MFHIMLCQIRGYGSVVRSLRLISERLPVLTQEVCFSLVAYARQPFLNLRKPNPLLPDVVVACIRETTPTVEIQSCTGTTVYKAL